MNYYNEILETKQVIDNSEYIVFFGGAGTSTESGISDFRGDRGLYQKTYKGYNPEEILSLKFVLKNPQIFYDFINEKLCCENAKPNAGHKYLVELENTGKLKAIITQNIDGLHQKAGSKNVIELHGNLREFYCMKCGREKDRFFDCECGGIVRPNIVLYGEPLDVDIVNRSISEVKKADCLIVSGTSLTVYPANSLLEYFDGKYFIIINTSPTQYDSMANIIIRKPFAETARLLTS
ncbi:NAD-dependent protein deacetylase [Caloramator mitchellensis]|uniref:protein acetyllysine N-acetyltransferase n=1 Tax=Caloramator mitchellensis TaxID=908809 RepID=A0A0R3JUH9_CALMK|nr:NAD-dependent protein deacylase [Caloramator mitchellensis]KRQ87211.1 NAD-dependent protein deacetylase [Caloramator mitchellensis]